MSRVAPSSDKQTVSSTGEPVGACYIRHNCTPPCSGCSPEAPLTATSPDSPEGIRFGAFFPTAELVEASAGLLTPREKWDGSEWNGQRHRIAVGPGVLVVSTENVNLRQKREERDQYDPLDSIRKNRRPTKISESSTDPGFVAFLAGSDDADDDGSVANEGRGTKQQITEWSAKSRANMVKSLAMLDYIPMFETTGMPAMVTLTYPGCSAEVVDDDRKSGRAHRCDDRCSSRQVAPDGKTVKRHMRAFRERFRRTWGDPHAVWKLEFQRRGVPHIHFFLAVPREKTSDGETFNEWVSRSWTEILRISNAEERAKHRAAGTGVDYSEGMKASDPQRLAVYFSKHGSANLGGAKEYQNEVPKDFEDVGRFWGYWRLQKAVWTVDVEYTHALAAARTLRHWHSAKGLTQRRKVWRQKINKNTGEIRWVQRWTTRRTRRFYGTSGFITANDAPALLSEMSRYLDQVVTDAEERKTRYTAAGFGKEENSAAAGFRRKGKTDVQDDGSASRVPSARDVPTLWGDRSSSIWSE